MLVEPDGTTGSYILFDKTTLTPIATVNLAGTQTIVNGQGTVSFLSSAQLSADAQKIITDVFAQKFTDNTNPKDTTHFTDSITQESLTVKLANGDTVPVTVKVGFVADNPAALSNPNTPPRTDHIDGPPTVVTFNSAFTERDNATHTVTHSSTLDTLSDKIRWVDINAGDLPSATAKFDSFSYKDANNHDVTASLTAEQLAAIQAVEIPLTVVQDPGNTNNGSATWTTILPTAPSTFLPPARR
ncbi:hypothetical protein [Bradyrhizobium sp. AZCC 2289]|uniref:hypothetical protein n=1 Tax=Bradyrhizobium sp. AZCC 2289 TaxID=3117026 RepID=UPI002FF32AD7